MIWRLGGSDMNCVRWASAALAGWLFTVPLHARPILFADSTTVMAEHAAGAMDEFQIFYAPKYFWSFGLGHLDLQSSTPGSEHRITYARVNFLAKRWNRESAQANVFVWGGVGRAHVGEWVTETTGPVDPDDHGHGAEPGLAPAYQRTLQTQAWNAGGQVDYETLRIYTSVKTDYHHASAFTHRVDTLQLGFAPYKHEVDSLATWLIVSGKRSSGDIHGGHSGHGGTEWSLLLRLFKKGAWLEAGASFDGKLQARAMISL
jgi:hypothetical protein